MTLSINISVTVDGYDWTVVPRDQYESTIDEIRVGNRWYRSGGHKYIQARSAPYTEPSDPLGRAWFCEWIPGQAGWNCTPVSSISHEDITRNNRDGFKAAYVRAPSALLAIERTKLLCMMRGTTL